MLEAHELDRIRAQIERQIERLLRAVGVPNAQIERVSDPLDLAADLTGRLDEAVVSQRARQELAELTDALRRLQERPETFGMCERCGNQIPEARLEIVPTTRRCNLCQG